MAIISVRIFIRSIVVRKKKKKSTWQYLRKNVHVHNERSSNCSRKAEQSSSSQLFPRLSIPPLFFPCRWSILNRYEHSRNWNLTCTVRGNFYRGHKTRGNPHSSRMTVFYRISKPEKPRRRFFFKRTCWYTFEIFIIDPVKRNVRPAYSR